MKFENTYVLITGGSKGIGLATSRAFKEAGATVAVLDLVAPTEPSDALYLEGDVSDPASVSSAIERLEEAWGELDILVNNAGIQHYGTAVDTSIDEWDHVMHVNLRSAFLCAKYSIPLMQQRGKGVIVNVSSVQAFISQERVAAYTTSKSALLGLTRSIAVDFAPEIRCVAVCPGTVDTPMLRDAIAEMEDPEAVLRECHAMHLTGRIGTPEEIADLILFLSSDKAAFITGQVIRIDGGLGIKIGGN